ncbi:MAG: proline--tRNA ligase [Burkholderiales bacterium]|nr:proline--tRNA ligase [Burkholderiales bacterium]OUT77708.1 MAG: proline--tRNA ligase [Betaproteobacteria bacterium TMED22]|tara:strand:+ start:7528 stop:9249 length:1722 start_codon:yes stop_codon:yes gene_type:complete
MRLTQFFLNTLREAPTEAELSSHRLMLRAGLIKKLGGGLYSWLPLGFRVLRKVENIVREEMDRAGGLEVLMPAIQPAELWAESGRWEMFGEQMLKIKDRHDREFCFGPTHEEVITDIARQDIKSYRQLPINLYQIQTKFRDEIRPRFGVMRAREFLMKDAYSFHTDFSDLEREYQNMFDTYCRIFERLGLKYRSVAADTGAIGGTGSHEFHVLAESGEDAIAYCPDSDYAANIELAEAIAPKNIQLQQMESVKKIATPNAAKCDDVAKQLSIPTSNILKTLALIANDQFVLILLRGDHQLNEIKLTKLEGMKQFRFATDEEVQNHLGCSIGFIGPMNIDSNIRIISDRSAQLMSNFACGANERDHHLTGINFDRDIKNEIEIADIRNVVSGDLSPDGKGTLEICRGIEVGHIFQLRTKYSKLLKCQYLDKDGKSKPTEMGCYGIGVSRIIAAAIEQGHDDKGIIWPQSIAPFSLAIAAIGYKKSELVRNFCDNLETNLMKAGVEVLLDDRGERPGVMFADLELIGIPCRLTVGERGINDGKLEWTDRLTGETSSIDSDRILEEIIAKVRDKTN